MKENNLFQYATKELSQDAMLCWLINWLNYPDSQMYSVGVSVLNMFLGENKQEKYFNVQVIKQYKKIDVLVLFNDNFALIIEDKTNTTEHGEQITRYKKLLEVDYPDKNIMTAYIKTGIMYDEDIRIIHKTDVVITLQDLLRELMEPAMNSGSEILKDYVDYLTSIADYRKEIDTQIDCGDYAKALATYYGQFAFLDRIFSDRSKGTEIGKTYATKDINPPVLIDHIYAGTNNGGTPWTQYCFWGQQYPVQLKQENELEYHYLFWRIDCNWQRINKNDSNSKYEPVFYIALRHYDANAHSVNEELNKRKREAYFKFRKIADEIYEKYYHEKNNPELYKWVGKRENYKESDLLFIPIDNLAHLSFEEIRKLLVDNTKKFISIK